MIAMRGTLARIIVYLRTTDPLDGCQWADNHLVQAYNLPQQAVTVAIWRLCEEFVANRRSRYDHRSLARAVPASLNTRTIGVSHDGLLEKKKETKVLSGYTII
jgi:hypothetical protein